MNASVIDLPAEAGRRERWIIALADMVRETIHADPEDPTPMQVSLREALAYVSALSSDEVDGVYNWHLAAAAVPAGTDIFYRTEHPPELHRRCLVRAREYLARVERDFGVQLLEPGRRP